jgi:dTDP-glucose 4,6-dehydratase
MRSSEARPVNLGNPIEHPVGEIAELVIELSGGEGGITCARETLGWEPRVSAREGLKKTLDWFAGRSSRPEASPAGR